MGSRKRPKPNPKIEPPRQSRPESSKPTNKEVEALKVFDSAVSSSDSETDYGADRKSTAVSERVATCE